MVFLKLSNKDIRFLNVAYNLGQVFGIVPFYKFESFSITYRNFKNGQAIILLILGIFGTGQCLYYRFFYFMEHWSALYLIINFIKEFFLVMAVLSAIVAASFQNQENWLKLNNYLQYIDTIFDNRSGKEKKNVICLQLVFYFTLYAVHIAYTGFVWCSKVGNFKFKMFWFNELAFLIDTVHHFLIFNLALALLNRYYQLNCLFDKKEISFSNLQKIEHVSRVLSEATRLYNEIFGWSILFSSGKCVCHLLQWFEETLYYWNGLNLILGYYPMSCSFVLFTAVNIEI